MAWNAAYEDNVQPVSKFSGLLNQATETNRKDQASCRASNVGLDSKNIHYRHLERQLNDPIVDCEKQCEKVHARNDMRPSID